MMRIDVACIASQLIVRLSYRGVRKPMYVHIGVVEYDSHEMSGQPANHSLPLGHAVMHDQEARAWLQWNLYPLTPVFFPGDSEQGQS